MEFDVMQSDFRAEDQVMSNPTVHQPISHSANSALSSTIVGRTQTLVHAQNTKDFDLYASLLSPSPLAEFSFSRRTNLCLEDCLRYLHASSAEYPNYFLRLKEVSTTVHRNAKGLAVEVEVFARGEQFGVGSPEIVHQTAWSLKWGRWKGEWLVKKMVIILGVDV